MQAARTWLSEQFGADLILDTKTGLHRDEVVLAAIDDLDVHTLVANVERRFRGRVALESDARGEGRRLRITLPKTQGGGLGLAFVLHLVLATACLVYVGLPGRACL